MDTEVAAIKAKTDNLPAAPAATGDCITAAGVRSAVGLASANLDTQLGAIDDYVDTEVAAILAAVDTEVATIVTAVGTTIPAQITALLTTAMTEGYRSFGATGSVRDILYEILSILANSAIVGTTRTGKKLDRSTTAKTYTLNDSNTPTSVQEAS